MPSPKSTSLFHFTKTLEKLKSILQKGFRPSYCREDASWMKRSEMMYMGIPMVSFCDIPLGRIQEHTGFYGKYGLGMSKCWAIENKLNPLFYVSLSSPIGKIVVDAILDAMDSLLNNSITLKKVEQLKFLSSYLKPISGMMVKEGKLVEKQFDAENEWRYVPQREDIQSILPPSYFADEEKRKAYDALLERHCMLKFNTNDIRYIFVARDSDIPTLVDFINGDNVLGTADDKKILLTRITSLEHLEKDV